MIILPSMQNDCFQNQHFQDFFQFRYQHPRYALTFCTSMFSADLPNVQHIESTNMLTRKYTKPILITLKSIVTSPSLYTDMNHVEKTGKFIPWKLFPFTSKRTRLNNAFEFVRSTFFPRWDTNRQWKAKYAPGLPSGGRADPDTKIIFLSSVPKELDLLYLLLIHEICHSATQSGHSKKWIKRLGTVCDKAKELNMLSLSEKLQEEINLYADPTGTMSLTAANVYSSIRSYVIVAVIEERSYGYKKIIRDVAKSYGLYPYEIEQLFKKCREAYDKAVKEAKETKKTLG